MDDVRKEGVVVNGRSKVSLNPCGVQQKQAVGSVVIAESREVEDVNTGKEGAVRTGSVQAVSQTGVSGSGAMQLKGKEGQGSLKEAAKGVGRQVEVTRAAGPRAAPVRATASAPATTIVKVNPIVEKQESRMVSSDGKAVGKQGEVTRVIESKVTPVNSPVVTPTNVPTPWTAVKGKEGRMSFAMATSVAAGDKEEKKNTFDVLAEEVEGVESGEGSEDYTDGSSYDSEDDESEDESEEEIVQAGKGGNKGIIRVRKGDEIC